MSGNEELYRIVENLVIPLSERIDATSRMTDTKLLRNIAENLVVEEKLRAAARKRLGDL